ncbi:MAG: FitA-like ribbon-helix-helix domain-containing protein [Bryobacteraceae bacterium]
MADVKVRHLPDWLVEWHKREAARQGVSLEQRLRTVLEDPYRSERRRLLKLLDDLAAETRRKCGKLPSSAPLIRAIRKEMEDH